MNDYKNELMLNVRVKELRDQLYNKTLPSDMSADDVFRLEDEVYKKSLEALNRPKEKLINLTEIKERFADAVNAITQDALKMQNSINSISSLDINQFLEPAAKTVLRDGAINVEFLKELPPGVELFVASVIDKTKVRDLTIEDIRDCGSMGDYEQVLLPFIHKVINKFKEINNI